MNRPKSNIAPPLVRILDRLELGNLSIAEACKLANRSRTGFYADLNGFSANSDSAPGTIDFDAINRAARAALVALDAHETDRLPLMLGLGETVSKAKKALKHGEFANWCRDDLKKSPSWCSAYRRLFESREDLETALAWAAMTEHKCASCRSVELLLKIITEWKRAARGDSAVAPKIRRKGDAIVVQLRRREIIAKLRQILEEAQDAFEALRYELALTAPAHDG